MSAARRLTVIVGALLLFRLASASVVSQPGYTDAYYYGGVARRVAAGQGLTADFIWNFLEAAPGGAVPVPSHRFWMPLATLLQSIGITTLPFVDSFRAAQAVELLVSLLIPVLAYRAARSLGGTANASLVAAAVAGLGGAFAPGWVSLDAFAPAAVLGTLFFLAYGRAARGDVDAAALAGLWVGLLFLARAEGAFFGLVFLPLLRHPATRRAGVVGAGVALAIGTGWLARDLSLGPIPDLFARSVLLVRYEDFFAVGSPTWPAFIEALPQVLVAKSGAIATNAATFVFAFGLLLVPGMVVAWRSRRTVPAARAFAALLILVYVVQSLVVTLHSTRGSYFHSLAAFFPFGVALGVIGTSELLRTIERRRVATVGGLAAALLLSGFSISEWDASFGAPYRARVAALASIPPGRFMAIDAAAWRWIGRRPVLVTPADLRPCAFAAASYSAVKWLVLEPAHFSAYDPLYRGEAGPPYIGAAQVSGDIRVYPIDLRLAQALCDSGK
ncbi:MAG: hypothetical protein ABI888_01145 [Chloroflexota bacterium]